MGVISDLYRGRNNYDVIGRRKLWLSIAAITVVVSLASLLLLGLNLSIDFRGGTVWKFSYAKGAGAAGEGGNGDSTATASAAVGASGLKPSESEIRDALGKSGIAAEKVLYLGNEQVEVQAGAVDAETARNVTVELALLVGVPAENAPQLVSATTVSPTWGGQVSGKALRALIVFLIAVSIYISWRFEWQMAVAAFVALIHDLVLTVGVYSVTRFTVAPATVIATLTILGYSLYDDVVVFDKIKDVSKSAVGLRRDYATLVNDSLNQVLMRSLNTSLSSLLPVGALLFGGVVMGSETLKYFALALFVGIIAGTYSSIFIATPLIVILGRPGSTSEAAIKAARTRREPAAAPRRETVRTRRPTAERMAEIAGDDEDETGQIHDEDEIDERPAEVPQPGVSKERPQGQPKKGQKSKKGRPRGSRPAGGKKGKRKKKR